MALELWAGKAIECSESCELLCGNMGDKNSERNEDDTDLACYVSERSLTVPLKHKHLQGGSIF